MTEKTAFDPRKFAVIGAGPVGCTVAAFLAKGGYEVTLCDIIPDLVKPAADSGIIIKGAENLQQTVTRTCVSVDELEKYDPDVIFLTVKANATPLIASAIEGFHKNEMYVISWQNGIDTELELANILGKKPAVRGVVNYGCALSKPCQVIIPFHHPPHFIQELDPESGSDVQVIAEVMTRCGLATQRTDQIASMVWRKSVMNASTNPVCAVTGMTLAQALNDPIVFEAVDDLAKECIRVARSNEIFLGSAYYPYCMDYMKSAGPHKPSMLIDIEAKRRTEIDFLNGKVIEYGRQAGIPTPCNVAIRSYVKGLEATF
ncbi:2-dehydropantoate 2-reductase [Desulfobacterales bacterium HSG2]|nr:2-dehydropantoate 2-reductase [Desulfobacterales bacterium HSG2]